MPKGNLMVIRNSDGKVVGTALPTLKRCQALIEGDFSEHKEDKDSYTIVTPFKRASEDGTGVIAVATPKKGKENVKISKKAVKPIETEETEETTETYDANTKEEAGAPAYFN